MVLANTDTSAESATKDSRIRVFLSYSWTSYDHQQWVLRLARDMQASNVHPIIDAWDLRPGDDSIRFMERMVNDPDVTKVLILSDKKYAERANDREGGVGTETTIISPEMYSKVETRKFALGVCQRDDQGQPYLPTYYKGRIYFDFSDESKYVDEFEKMLRWVHDKHAEERPTTYGPTPSFLLEKTGVDLGTNMYARRTMEAFRTGKAHAIGSLSEYLEMLAKHLDRLRITRDENRNFDDQVVESFELFKPYRDEFIEVLNVAIRQTQPGTLGDVLHNFFEQIIPYTERPNEQQGSWYSDAFDNYRLICRELFLVTNALALKTHRFDISHTLLNRDYYSTAVPGPVMHSFGVLARSVESMDRRKQRLQSRRANLVADLLLERTNGTSLSRDELLQADFFLYFKAHRKDDRWHPATHVFAGGLHKPFEIFARASSDAYWRQVAALLDADDLEKFKADVKSMRQYGDGFNATSVELLTNIDQLSTRP